MGIPHEMLTKLDTHPVQRQKQHPQLFLEITLGLYRPIGQPNNPP
jgi:hypothetical protein